MLWSRGSCRESSWRVGQGRGDQNYHNHDYHDDHDNHHDDHLDNDDHDNDDHDNDDHDESPARLGGGDHGRSW